MYIALRNAFASLGTVPHHADEFRVTPSIDIALRNSSASLGTRPRLDVNTLHNCDDSYAETAPVGSYPANKFGLHDMLGNVWEWCANLYGEDYYASRPDKEKNPFGPSSASYGSMRVVRGGGWNDSPDDVRAANRSGDSPDDRDYFLGFRLLLPCQQGQASR